MADASSAPRETSEDAGLELDRRGTRFLSPEVERAYGQWQMAQSMPFNRAVLWGGVIGIWVFITTLTWVLFGERLFRWLPWIAVLIGIAVVGLMAARASS